MMKKYGFPVVICLIVLAACIGVLQWRSLEADERMVEAVEETSAAVTEEATQDETPATADSKLSLDGTTLVMGAADAPITILEFSSLSCPHCATFHRNTLGVLKKDYVDSGKVKFVFNDFPLNKPALDATLLLKCVDDLQNRYDMMELLFQQQDQWAFEADHRTKLKQYAALLGLGGDQAEACMNDAEMEKTVFAKMQTMAQQYEVRSTPTFVILPSDKRLQGAQDYSAFSVEIEKLLKEERE